MQQSTSTLEAWGGGCTKVDTSAGTPPLPLLPPRPPCLGRCPPLPAGADQQTTQTEGAHLRANKHTPLQESLLSALEGRLHFHWKVNCEEPLDEPTTACFAFHGVLPDACATFVTPPQSRFEEPTRQRPATGDTSTLGHLSGVL